MACLPAGEHVSWALIAECQTGRHSPRFSDGTADPDEGSGIGPLIAVRVGGRYGGRIGPNRFD
jgi:hypothetical protein